MSTHVYAHGLCTCAYTHVYKNVNAYVYTNSCWSARKCECALHVLVAHGRDQMQGCPCVHVHVCMYEKACGPCVLSCAFKADRFLHDHLLASMQDVCTVNTWHHANEQNGERDVFRLRQGGLVEQTRLPAPPNLWLQSDKCKTCRSHMHTNIHERTHACSQARTPICTCARTCTHKHMHTRAQMCASTRACVHMDTCIDTCMHICGWQSLEWNPNGAETSLGSIHVTSCLISCLRIKANCMSLGTSSFDRMSDRTLSDEGSPPNCVEQARTQCMGAYTSNKGIVRGAK